MLVFASFLILIGLTALRQTFVGGFANKPWQDWVLDGVGLWVQGILIPIVQIILIHSLWAYLLPSFGAQLTLGFIPAFLLSFVGVDYLYYWNHRLLHSRLCWAVHSVHHTVTDMDVMATSRNTLWSSFLIIYVWIHALLIYLLADPTAYILGVSLSSALDLWRHSAFSPTPNQLIYRLLAPWLILPTDHAWHHGRGAEVVNFGANLKVWDQLHGTYFKSDRPPTYLGTPTSLSLVQKLLFPFKTS
ncbi:MAG: sterol desaturase family protein [Elainellaceae cyanobacterium]